MPYSAKYIGQVDDTCNYRIEERNGDKLVRMFTGRVSCSQRAAAKGWKEHSDERKVERWCELDSRKLPKDGGTVDINLDEVAIE